MIKIIETVTDFFQWVIEIFKTIGQMIVTLVGVLSSCLNYVKNILSILPSWMYVILVVLIVVCVVYKVLGREGNS